MIRFEWHSSKAASNLAKHQVSFEEAQTVFYDDFAVQFFDEAHSDEEERFLMLGRSVHSRLLIVCHCEREEGGVIRIVSARKATKREAAFYQGL
ncbi:MAG: BrnT family toxin [Burkholderiales bacterium]|nr:MAG: BrnT family toxin [Burkholderiales bacterium]